MKLSHYLRSENVAETIQHEVRLRLEKVCENPNLYVNVKDEQPMKRITAKLKTQDGSTFFASHKERDAHRAPYDLADKLLKQIKKKKKRKEGKQRRHRQNLYYLTNNTPIREEEYSYADYEPIATYG